MEFCFLYFLPPDFCDDRPLVIKRAIRALMTRLINHVAFPLFFFFSLLIYICYVCAGAAAAKKKTRLFISPRSNSSRVSPRDWRWRYKVKLKKLRRKGEKRKLQQTR
jgi:hypothetical protein